MSRSRRKSKIYGTCSASSEKANKQWANRKLRRVVKYKLKAEDPDLPHLREVSNVWDFDKDGKKYYPEISDKLMIYEISQILLCKESY